MKRIPGLLILVFVFSGCLAQNAKFEVKQEQVADPFLWDFGKIKEGTIVTHEFKFHNDSKKVLKIKDITASCGCTVPKIKDKALSPGESTVIEVKFKSKGYSGPVMQYVYVDTDNLDNPVIRFIIKADVNK
ncbi:MAG: DUF1573 domain-containing protein [Candidatus Omnitrophica bacterium]|nr:DUF1573 domain-containing protein [Candidatus Omnitrophota bacterium]MDD5652824.1 DUF1573 domain-containing protein [Candidatus Omnitrophota bacterium]